MTPRFASACLALAAAVATGAQAHVGLIDKAAPAGSSYRAAFKVGHGCEGAPTTGLRVSLPAGLRGAKPMPKPGWTLTLQRAPLATPYTSHGKTVTDDVVEVSWTAGPGQALPDAFYDEFVLQGQLTEQPGPLWFKVLQSCEGGQIDWAEIPASGTATQGLKAPAVLLQVTPAGHAGHSH